MRKKFEIIITFSLFCISLICFSTDAFARYYSFAGGPPGGTYTHYAKAIATLAAGADVDVQPMKTQGSIDNIKKIQRNLAKFGIAYSGDIYLARNGKLKRDTRRYKRVMAMGYFYSAPAQLVVRADSGIKSALDLKDKRVGVGNFGSGAAGNCELFFKELGIWEQVYREFVGYKKAALAFKGGEIDAFWLFTGFPNSSVNSAAGHTPIALIDVFDDAKKIGLFKKYPYFSKVDIPAGTYKGVATATRTFQDSTVWIVNERVPQKVVYKLLETVYSPEGLKFMVDSHKSAKVMSVENGLRGIVTPLHPGAEKFWKEKGVLKP